MSALARFTPNLHTYCFPGAHPRTSIAYCSPPFDELEPTYLVYKPEYLSGKTFTITPQHPASLNSATTPFEQLTEALLQQGPLIAKATCGPQCYLGDPIEMQKSVLAPLPVYGWRKVDLNQPPDAKPVYVIVCGVQRLPAWQAPREGERVGTITQRERVYFVLAHDTPEDPSRIRPSATDLKVYTVSLDRFTQLAPSMFFPVPSAEQPLDPNNCQFSEAWETRFDEALANQLEDVMPDGRLVWSAGTGREPVDGVPIPQPVPAQPIRSCTIS